MSEQRNDSLDLYIALSRASEWVNAHGDRDIRNHGLNRTEFEFLSCFIIEERSRFNRLAVRCL